MSDNGMEFMTHAKAESEPPKWCVRLFSNALWDYYGEPEYFDTRRQAQDWIKSRKQAIAEHDCEARIERVR